MPKNLLANISYFAINIVIGLVLVPYFISTLGVAAYGLIPLATSITGYVGIVVQSLNTSVSRFLTIDLQREDYPAANKTFNTAILGISSIIALMVPVIIVAAFFIPRLFNVPAGQEQDTIFLFLGVFAAFLISAWSGNFTVQLFAYNRLDLQNLVSATNIIVSATLIFISFHYYGPSLVFVGLAYVIGATAASVLSIILAKRVCPGLKLSFRSFDYDKLKAMGNMGMWSMVNQMGTLLFLQIDLIVVNTLFGAASAGQYAVILMWATLLRTIANTIAGVLTPVVFTNYAKGNIDALIKVTNSAVRLMGIFLALPIGLICGLAPQILTIWVGEKFVFLAPLLVLMAIHLTINLSVLPLFSVNVAYNKIQVPGILTLLMGGLNIALAFSIPLMFGAGFYGVALAGAIVLTLKNAVFTPWYAARVMGIDGLTFTRSVITGLVPTVIVAAASAVTGLYINIASMTSLVLAVGILGLVYLILVWKLGLTAFERELFRSYLPKNLRRSALSKSIAGIIRMR
ncbi:MAG TPA: oligosaccharide flippase family protein [Methanocella sp.]